MGSAPTPTTRPVQHPALGPVHYNIQTTAWLDNTSPTGTTNPHANPLGLGYDLGHQHSAFVTMCDPNVYGACAMDGAANVQWWLIPLSQVGADVVCPTA